VDHFAILAPSGATAGDVTAITVVAEDAANNPVTDYTGTVQFQSSDADSVLPHPFTFTTADQGAHTFKAILTTAGAQAIRVSEVNDAGVHGSTGALSIGAASLDHFVVTAPDGTSAGAAFDLVVTAEDAYGNAVKDYTGTVHLNSSDGQNVGPDDYTFTTDDHGTHTFSITLETAGMQSIRAADLANPDFSGSADVLVSAGAVSQFQVSAPANTVAGQAFAVTVTALDQFGNVVKDYTGTVTFGSSDGQAILPFSFTFTLADQGAHTFNVMLKTAAKQSVSVADTQDTGAVGSADVKVAAGALDHFTVMSPDSIPMGKQFSVRVTAMDAFGNRIRNYKGPVDIWTTDGDGESATHFRFGPNSFGHKSSKLTLHTPGLQSVLVGIPGDPRIRGSATMLVMGSGRARSGQGGGDASPSASSGILPAPALAAAVSPLRLQAMQVDPLYAQRVLAHQDLVFAALAAPQRVFV
jgi:hypothetical protein